MTGEGADRSSNRDATAIERLDANATVDALDGLVDVLGDVVAGGASVGFLAPLPLAQAEAFWRGVGDSVDRGEIALFVARDDVASPAPCNSVSPCRRISPTAPRSPSCSFIGGRVASDWQHG